MELLVVLITGGLGSLLRYVINKNLVLINVNPFISIMIINTIACFLLGFLLPFSDRMSPWYKAAIFSGFIGGLGTFTSYVQFALNRPITVNSLMVFLSPLFLGLWAMIIGFWLGDKATLW